MRLGKLTGIAGTAMLATLLAAGGCNACQKQLTQWQQKGKQLSDQNKQLQGDLVSEKGATQDLRDQLANKDTEITGHKGEIAGLNAEIARLHKKPAVPPEGNGGKTPPGWKQTAAGDEITVGSDVLFGSGKSDLSPVGKAAMNKVVAALRANYAGKLVRVYGYSDSDPIVRTRRLYKDNLELSAKRAMSVTRYLISKGIKAEKIETIAMGATHFVASNNTVAGKKKNRRVKILAVK